MKTLFSDIFPIIKTNTELQTLQERYAQYDPYYVTSGSMSDRKIVFERLFQKFEPYADTHFLTQVKKHFHERTWEMYLACAFLDNGFKITSKDQGPDMRIDIDDKTLWIECVATTHGKPDSPDRVPEDGFGMHCVPEEKMILRLTNSLCEKYDGNGKNGGFKKYVQEHSVGVQDPYVIAVNRGILGWDDPDMPMIFKCLFNIGDFTMPIDITTQTAGESYYAPRLHLPKSNGSPVPMGFFGDEVHAGISAVIYSRTTVLNHPEKLGSDCILVHNPYATNPLSEEAFPFLEQYKVRDGFVVKI